MIKISKAIHDQMIEHAKKHYPQEACGFLVGKGDEARYFEPILNMDQSSVTYSMDPKQQMRAFKKMDEEGLEMIGIFHSHVASAAYPSQTDKQQAFYPDASYLIVSLSNMDAPDLKSFKIVEGKVIPEELEIQ